MSIKTCQEAWLTMTKLSTQGEVRNFTQTLDMTDFTVTTELFPIAALEAYTAWNLELPLTEAQQQFFNSQRGGDQGDYRSGMQRKIANVVDCLTHYPNSKRALISIANDAFAHHACDEKAKCLREIHFHLNKNTLNATCFFRAQAALIFPKNIHFIGSLMQTVAEQLPTKPQLGKLFYLTTVLVADRS